MQLTTPIQHNLAKHDLAKHNLETVDPIWASVQDEGRRIVRDDPLLTSFVHSCVLSHDSLEEAIAHRIAQRLDHADYPAELLVQDFRAMLRDITQWATIVRVDMQAVYERDPACSRYIEPVLYFKGFHAIQTHRLAHWLFHQGRKDTALYLQSRSSAVFQVDIHPAVQLGQGIFFDHATGIVVGMTATIDDDVSILQGVTLGGTGKEIGDRHPKIKRGVLIGAGAEILGNIEIGACSKVAAGSVVLIAVPPGVTVAGVPAKIVGTAGCADPARSMDQMISAPE